MTEDYSQASEAETNEFWDEKARANKDNPSRAVGVDDELRTRCIENAQRIVVGRALRRAVSSLDGKTERVLDFGCGVGRWLPHLDANFDAYLGVDISSEMLDIARKNYPQSKFSRLNNFTIDAEDTSFCLAFCIAVLHHNSYVNQDALIRELSRVVRPGGQLLLLESKGARMCGSGRIFYSRPVTDWIETVESEGFRHVETTGTCYQFADRIFAKVFSRAVARRPLMYRTSIFFDSQVMPYITPMLPGRFHERVLMRFERSSA
ncbi:MAG: class I SAM-dependent methyltransferase [Woeseiaceae bacterium]|nr:class I SAM-dependent methyltransferase [Woeseiaceae bacterium]